MTTKLTGVFPALVTPMTAEQELDLAALERLVDYLITTGGVHGVIPLGSTGEYYALSPAEREAVIKTTKKTVGDRVPMLVGTNAGSTRDVIASSRQAQELGAAGVLLAAPYYSLPTQDELFAHFQAVNDAIDIPIMLYNYPGRTGVDMLPDLIERLAGLSNVQYVKESTGDITRVSEILRRCGDKITVFCGCDTEALENFLLGSQGWVSGAVNFVPQKAVELFRLGAEERDFEAARTLDFSLLPILSLLESGKYTQLCKAGCSLIGQPVGPPRQPLIAVTDAEVAELKKLVDAL